jgi:hypothetical protein
MKTTVIAFIFVVLVGISFVVKPLGDLLPVATKPTVEPVYVSTVNDVCSGIANEFQAAKVKASLPYTDTDKQKFYYICADDLNSWIISYGWPKSSQVGVSDAALFAQKLIADALYANVGPSTNGGRDQLNSYTMDWLQQGRIALQIKAAITPAP